MTLTKHISFPIYYDAASPKELALARWFRRMLAAKKGAGKSIPQGKPIGCPLVWQGGEALGAREGFPGGGQFR